MSIVYCYIPLMKFVDDYETYLAENMINVVVEGGNASL